MSEPAFDLDSTRAANRRKGEDKIFGMNECHIERIERGIELTFFD